MTTGFWATRGATSTVDWCEANYSHSIYIAEWWNTWSSFPIAAAGILGLIVALRRRAPSSILLGYTLIALVGLGSALFHGTLLKVGQALDELPMVWAGLSLTYVLLEPALTSGARRRLLAGLITYGVAFSAAYFVAQDFFGFFLATYALLVAGLFAGSAWISLRPSATRRLRILFACSAGAYVGGVLFLWVPEHLVLPCDHPLQALELHALFHLSSAAGSAAWLEWALARRATATDRMGAGPRRS